MLKKIRQTRQATDDIMRRMRIACWIPKSTNTHSEYVILIALPLQQRLHESASMLSYTYTVCLVYLFLITKVRCDYEYIMYLFTQQVYKVQGRTVCDTH